jgi:hypothetical protein
MNEVSKEVASAKSKLPEVYYLSESNRYYMEDATGVFRGYLKAPVSLEVRIPLFYE